MKNGDDDDDEGDNDDEDEEEDFMTRFRGKTVKVKHIRVVHPEIFLYEHFT